MLNLCASVHIWKIPNLILSSKLSKRDVNSPFDFQMLSSTENAGYFSLPPSTSFSKYIVLSFFLVVLITLYITLNLRNYGLYTGNHPFFAAQPCEYLDSEQKDQLLNMAYNVHKTLDDFGIEHWLMYGSVFGAIRTKGPLPWDNDVDIGFNGSGTFASIDFNEFLWALESKGLKVYHKRWFTSNVMKVYSEDLPYINVDLFALYNYGGTMKRAGLETWILAINYNLYHAFPARLVEKPLPQVPFGSYKMPVPREGIEIQK